MTLRKKDEDIQPEFDPVEVMRMKKFSEWILELAVYLGHFELKRNGYNDQRRIRNVGDYFEGVLLHKPNKWGKNEPLTENPTSLCLAGRSNNPLVIKVVETIFPRGESWTGALPYGCNISKFCYKYEKEHMQSYPPGDYGYSLHIWRDDIQFPDQFGIGEFNCALGSSRSWSEYNNRKPYTLFWNLFLIALDDNVFNECLSRVVELAYYLDFDEPMLRDWCRAVEYVMNGKKLSPDCDLECETVEGARFFLHKEE